VGGVIPWSGLFAVADVDLDGAVVQWAASEFGVTATVTLGCVGLIS
jgi:hypothetical protein